MSKSPKAYSVIKEKTSYSISRIGALYKDFQDDKILNPEGYHANLISWSNILRVALENDLIEGSKLSVPHRKPDLALELQLPTIGKPLSMEVVIQELTESKSIIPVSLYLAHESNINNYIHPQVGFLTYFAPSHWSARISNLGSSLFSIFVPSSERYIHWDYLVEFGKQFLTMINKEIVDGVYSTKIFDERLILTIVRQNMTSNFSELDLRILLTYISRDVEECTIKKNEDNITVIKFVKDSSVTAEDIGIAHLRYNDQQLLNRMEHIEENIEEIKQRLKTYPTEKIKKDEAVKAVVMNLLSQKRSQVKLYQQCVSTYGKLQDILLKIDDATSNVGIVNALKQSSKALKQLNSKVDTNEIDDIHLEIEEQIDNTNQISDALGQGVADEDVREEYEALLKDSEASEQETDKLLEKLQDLKVESSITEEKDEKEESKGEKEERTPVLAQPLESE